MAREAVGAVDTDDLDGLIKQYGDELGRAVKAALPGGMVDIRTDTWQGEARDFPIELIIHADELDWEEGLLSVWLHEHTRGWVGEFDYLELEQEGDDLQVDLSDMCFSLESIEMLAPNGQIPKRDELPSSASRPNDHGSRRGGPGRRREYDWEGASFHLIGEAEKNSIAPDPAAHGAQADIKRKLADWFSSNGGKVPADSQLQAFAARALNAIRNAKP